MGRLMPVECEHGVTVDWGDFGPCQDCQGHALGQCPNFERCKDCDIDRLWRAVVKMSGAAGPAHTPRWVLNLMDDDGNLPVSYPTVPSGDDA